MTENEKANLIGNRLNSAGFETVIVGGAVRNEMLGIPAKDIDIATAASPADIKRLFPEFPATGVGESFGITVLVIDGEPFEIAQFRADIGGKDGRHPDRIETGVSLEDDLSRRDFTMNAIAVNVTTKEMTDPFNGVGDINNSLIRFVGDPELRIAEDKLRILRAFRFQSQLGFNLDFEAFRAIQEACRTFPFEGVSQERITSEFAKIVAGKNAVKTIELMAEMNILFMIIPELKPLLEPHNSPKWHNETFGIFGDSIFAHTMCVFNHSVMRGNNVTRRLAALFHDIGKPACRENRGDHDRFLGHDVKGAEIARQLMKRMKFANDITDDVTEIVRCHMNVHDLPKMKKVAAIRQFLARPLFDDIVEMGTCDTLGTLNAESPEPDLSILNNFVTKAVIKFGKVLPAPLVTGDDLIAGGLKPGHSFKWILSKTMDQQLTNESMNKEKLLKFALGLKLPTAKQLTAGAENAPANL